VPEATQAGSVGSAGTRDRPIALGPLDRGDLRRQLIRALVLALAVLGAEAAYLFFVTAGTLTSWPTYNANYDLQAEGFRAGHLYLSVAPSPELLAQSDPFDPVHRPLWAWDLTLYKGHYYMYWGPFPALALMVAKAALGLRSTIGDQYLVFAFYSIYLVSGAVLIDRMTRRLFPSVPLPMVALAIAVFAFANPSPFLLATAGIYQAAIVGGQAFLVTGLVFAFDAVWKARRGSHSAFALLASGTCWALAIGCRVSTGPAVLLLTILTVFSLRRASGGRWHHTARDFVSLATPVGMGVALLLVYNKQRFDSWLDFGTAHQLSTMQFRTSRSYLLANVYSYLLRPMISSCQFPFVTAPWNIGARAFPVGFTIGEGYWVQEPLAGMLLAVPWAWLVPIGVYAWMREGLSRAPGRLRAIRETPAATLWCGAAFAIIGSVTMFPVAGLFIATMRYLADVNAGVTLFATWAAWWLCVRVRRRGRVLRIGTYAITSARMHNPRLHERIVGALSRCDGP
jgi:hypothetical protein